MMRLSLVICCLAGNAFADDQTAPDSNIAPVVEAAPDCDTCLARQNGKRALRDYLAKKRAEEDAELLTEDKTNE